MRDSVSFHRAGLLHPAIRQEVIKLITQIETGLPPAVRIRITEGMRTMETQALYFAKGRTAPGHKITNARPGQSFHNYGLAIDFAILYDKDGDGKFTDLSYDLKYDFDKDGVKDWMEVVNVFKKAGYTWGGDFVSLSDSPHLEKNFGYNYRTLMEKVKNKEFIPGTTFVKI